MEIKYHHKPSRGWLKIYNEKQEKIFYENSLEYKFFIQILEKLREANKTAIQFMDLFSEEVVKNYEEQ